MDKDTAPKTMEGATHITPGGEAIKAVHWKKDGDHPLVERYPIERREFKGLLRAKRSGGQKDLKYALRFGDWICEDAKGRFWIVDPAVFEASYKPIAPSAGDAVAAVVTLLALAYGVLFGQGGELPVFFAVTHLMYYSILLAQWNGTTNSVLDLDEAVDDIRVSAHTNTYTVNQDTHNFWDDVTNEVSGTNYTTGGAALASQTLTRSTTTVTFDATDTVWTQHASGFSNARKFVVYRFNATPGNAPLFSVITADGDVGNVTGDLTLQYNASGIATWSTT